MSAAAASSSPDGGELCPHTCGCVSYKQTHNKRPDSRLRFKILSKHLTAAGGHPSCTAACPANGLYATTSSQRCEEELSDAGDFSSWGVTAMREANADAATLTGRKRPASPLVPLGAGATSNALARASVALLLEPAAVQPRLSPPSAPALPALPVPTLPPNPPLLPSPAAPAAAAAAAADAQPAKRARTEDAPVPMTISPPPPPAPKPAAAAVVAKPVAAPEAAPAANPEAGMPATAIFFPPVLPQYMTPAMWTMYYAHAARRASQQ